MSRCQPACYSLEVEIYIIPAVFQLRLPCIGLMPDMFDKTNLIERQGN